MLNDYKQCTDAEFETALNMWKSEVKEIPDIYLYILYTKFDADANALSGISSYATGLSIDSRKKSEAYKRELIRRGLLK